MCPPAYQSKRPGDHCAYALDLLGATVCPVTDMEISSGYDLREFFRRVGGFSGERAGLATPKDRPMVDQVVELLDDNVPHQVQADPLTPAGFVDGIQSSLCVTYRQHRPVLLSYVAAGCLSPSGDIVGAQEKFFVVASAEDREWFDSLSTRIPLVELVEKQPEPVLRAASAYVSDTRDNLERQLVVDLLDGGAETLVVDGSLTKRPPRAGVVGVVKTTRRQYLPDESVLWGLPAGFRSPRFRIPAGSQGVQVDRFSCYLRLQDAQRHAWDFGLVRLEAFALDELDPLAALALSERQSSRSGDLRFDRHLSGVRAVEDVLRARRPNVFSL